MQMDKNKILDDIFANDPFGLLNVKPSSAPARNADERLVASFQVLNDFFEKNKREPQLGGEVQEHMLYSRLKNFRDDAIKIEMLKPYDKYNLLDFIKKEYNSIDDSLNDDSLNLLESEAADLFELKHVKSQHEREETDFVARRKPCKDFAKYEPIFKDVQKDLACGTRELVAFKEDNLREGDFYVHNGILLLLEKVDFLKEVQQYRSGSRERKDGRTRVIFENGTESNMLYRSLYKALLDNGKAVSKNSNQVNESIVEYFANVTEEDKEAGYIYILKSKSTNPEIQNINNLYKIGYSKIEIAERIKNAEQEPTYLMAAVSVESIFKCYNMNPQKLEQLLHNFFGSSCLSLDVFDAKGERHTPREWFIAPLHLIEKSVHLIISGEILKYRYDSEAKSIILTGVSLKTV